MKIEKIFFSNEKTINFKNIYVSHSEKFFSIWHIRYIKKTIKLNLQSNYMNNYHKDLKYEIRKFEKDSLINIEILYESLNITHVLFYNMNSTQKNILDQSIIDEVSVLKYNDLIVTIHFYTKRNDIVRLTYSVNKRDNNSQFKGRCNRYLHHRDLLEFSSRGFNTYDWGNINFNTSKLEKISKFKIEFGGKIELVYNYIPWLSLVLKKLKII